MNEKRILNNVRTLVGMLVFSLALVFTSITSYAYDEEVVDYIAQAIENAQSMVTIKSYNVTKGEIDEVFELAKAKNYELAYTYDWIRISNYSYVNDVVYTITIKYDFDGATTKAETATRYEKVKAQLDKIVAMVDDEWSDDMKILFVHDYLINQVSYDYDNYLAGTVDDAQFCLYGTLIEKEAVCEGYSKAFMVIMHRLGIECELVESNEMAHMWNAVKVNGSWYHIDLTWDDPVMYGADKDIAGRVAHNYFLLSDTGIASDEKHTSWDASAPKCTSKLYDNWKYADSTSMFIPIGEEWYYSHPGQNDNLVRRSSSGVESVVTSNGAYGLAEIDGRIYYTDKDRKDIYRYYNGTNTLVYTITSDYYVSALTIDGTKMTVAVYDRQPVYKWLDFKIDSSYNIKMDVSYSGKVTNLKASSNGATSIKLTWTAASGATGYKVYLYNSSTGKYTFKKSGITSTSYTVTGLGSAKEYKFKVVACKNNGFVSVDSSAGVTVSGCTLPASTGSVSYVAHTMTTLTVKYPSVSNAAGYRIQVYNPATKKTVKTVYTSAVKYKVTGLTKGTKYNVYVTPYRWYNGKRLFAAERKAVALTTKTGNPTLKVSTQNSTSVKLTWNKVAGATGYRVYKYSSSKKTYVKYKDVTTNSCTVYKLSPGKNYTFAIRPYTKVTSSVSGTKTTKTYYSDRVTLKACTAPASPKPTLSTANKAITVKWSKVTGATSYTVYYKISAKGTWKKAGTTSKTSYKISNLVKGKKYYVTVKAYKKYNTQNAASVTTTKSIVVK